MLLKVMWLVLSVTSIVIISKVIINDVIITLNTSHMTDNNITYYIIKCNILVTPKAAAKHKRLFNKPASGDVILSQLACPLNDVIFCLHHE
jgi:hypothetical protein